MLHYIRRSSTFGATKGVGVCVKGLFQVRPIPFRPFPFRPNISRFAIFFFRPFQLRPFSIICPALLLLCPISFPSIFHFAKKPSRPTFPFRPMTISPFSHKAPSHFAKKKPFFRYLGPNLIKSALIS